MTKPERGQMETETPGAIIGRRLRELREAGFYTRHELAERSGLSEQGIAHLERGRAKRPRRETLEKAAKGLGVPIGALLRETGGEATEAATPTTEDVYAQMDRLYERHAAGEIDTETLLQRTAD